MAVRDALNSAIDDEMTADERSEQTYSESLPVEMSRFEIKVHNKLISETLLKYAYSKDLNFPINQNSSI